MPSRDPRNITEGSLIPVQRYADQPYVVRTDDGAWLCTVTTGPGREGEPGQHVRSMRSADFGRTWSEPLPLEDPAGPESAYSTLLKTPGGRIYCFYNYNSRNIREVVAPEAHFKGGICRRVDTMGDFVLRYTDDGGRTWSAKRYVIPVREFDCDRTNHYGGKVRFFWHVGRGFIHEGGVYCTHIKLPDMSFARSEGTLLYSPDLLKVTDPAEATWHTWPEGTIGLRAPAGGGTVSEEQSVVPLSDGSFFCVYRTEDGHPACAYSRDGGRRWSAARYVEFADGRQIRHPRAACFVWRCANGKFLLWNHNNGASVWSGRNPAWLCGGVEADGPEGRVIRWSQPEIALYDDDPMVRISYPDLIEDGGRYFITETQKNLARVHEVDPALVEGLWRQFEPAGEAAAGELLALSAPEELTGEADMPKLPAFCIRDNTQPQMGTGHQRQGFSIEFAVAFDSLEAGQGILDARDSAGRGVCVQTAADGAVEVVLSDGLTESRWSSDAGLLKPGRRHHVVATVDGGPHVVTFVVDGALCDGGTQRPYGWGWFNAYLTHVNWAQRARLASGLRGRLSLVRIYGRALRTSEAVGNCKQLGVRKT